MRSMNAMTKWFDKLNQLHFTYNVNVMFLHNVLRCIDAQLFELYNMWSAYGKYMVLFARGILLLISTGIYWINNFISLWWNY